MTMGSANTRRIAAGQELSMYHNAPEEGEVWRGPRRGNAIFFGGKGMGGGGQTVLTLRLPEDKFAANKKEVKGKKC